MKRLIRFLSVVIVLALVSVLLPDAILADASINVTIDGQAVLFENHGPVIADGRTLVPVRGVFEAMGFYVSWDGDTRTATLTRNGNVVEIILDSDVFTANGDEFQLEVPAQLIEGRTMLPIRAVLESVGYYLDWDGDSRTVIIASGEGGMIVLPVVVNVPVSAYGPDTEIGRHLGVEYVISTTELTRALWDHMEGETVRWHVVELSQPLDMSRFPSVGQWPLNEGLGGLFPTQTGDVLIVTHPDGTNYLYVDIGHFAGHPDDGYEWREEVHRNYIRIQINIELNPTETIGAYYEMWRIELERRREENETRFGMTRRYTSDNFYWYSNSTNARWLPEIASGVEARVNALIDVFGEPSQRMYVWYYSREDYDARYVHEFGMISGDPDEGAGHAWGRVSVISKPRNITGICPMVTELIMHEAVHILQWYLHDFLGVGEQSWIVEGTATYFMYEPFGMSGWRSALVQRVRSNNIPTLNYLYNDETFWANAGINYRWAASIFQFIHDNWGVEYIVEKNLYHGDYQGIFGISRSEFEHQWHQWLRNTFR